MAMRKTAITVPDDVLEQVDEAARERGESRSRFISRVLGDLARARRDAEISRRLNALFGEPGVAEGQRRVARELGRAAHHLGAEDW